jgi:hypothetical protein
MPLSLSKLKEMANNLPKNHSARLQWQCCTHRQQQASDINNAVGHLIWPPIHLSRSISTPQTPLHSFTMTDEASRAMVIDMLPAMESCLSTSIPARQPNSTAIYVFSTLAVRQHFHA